MRPVTKWIVITVVAIVLIGLGWFVFVSLPKTPEPIAPVEVTTLEPERKVIGYSVEGREIEAFTFVRPGAPGNNQLLFVGGIHGGYEWNSVLLAYEFMDYLRANPKFLPENIAITVIPSANPDGLFEVIGKEGRFTLADATLPSVQTAAETTSGLGRFNAHDVDLNRNFDCKWKPTSSWRAKTVSAGTAPFSEPEASAIQNFVLTNNPEAVVFWHSQANAVYASECEAGILPETLDVMNAYSKAAGYTAVQAFDAYPVSGDAEGWLASIGIPAITVELSTHETIEWEKNLAGVKALLGYYGLTP